MAFLCPADGRHHPIAAREMHEQCAFCLTVMDPSTDALYKFIPCCHLSHMACMESAVDVLIRDVRAANAHRGQAAERQAVAAALNQMRCHLCRRFIRSHWYNELRRGQLMWINPDQQPQQQQRSQRSQSPRSQSQSRRSQSQRSRSRSPLRRPSRLVLRGPRDPRRARSPPVRIRQLRWNAAGRRRRVPYVAQQA